MKKTLNYFPAGAETDNAVAAIRGTRALYSQSMQTAMQLVTEIRTTEKKCGVALIWPMSGDVCECSIVFNQAKQDLANSVQGKSDTPAGAIAAAYIMWMQQRTAEKASVERATKRVHTIEGADFEVATSGHAKLAEHEYDEEHAEVAT